MSEQNIFREVDEELRSDRMRALWRRFAPYVIGAAVGVVLVVAVNEGWSWYVANNAAESSEELYAAFDLIEGGDLAAAQAQLDAVIVEGSGRYPVLAQFRKAGVLARAGDTAEAVALYDALANTEPNPHLRELALVLGGTLMVDAGNLADVEARVGSIANDESPLRNAAREALGLAHYKAGNLAAAQASFEAVVNDPLTQSTTRNRMGYYLAQLLSQGAGAEAPLADAATDSDATTVDAVVVEDAATDAPLTPATPATITEVEPVAQ
ncbi:MAG TPA: tetratricopeptide repeat protein [Devosia sp.]|jgi:hypothetical protein|nr:tetratricopeptide repeat protein [Devosia sp.]